ncbi:S-adenosylmethionine decarboxylase [Colwellia sp. E2M01]|uniref:S-adenosylmethionine decarboxylase n=1 Tax=Colwellia sp. E2M01 TaxID=2841561 RepID=UPI001C0A3D25|nr:S-adenosylmethionine decarboxylase [Colwellia sp. E2M01]MBU2870774.1 S-adenosylmethionine decarboxylase [Colwellia sp. E2M01]
MTPKNKIPLYGFNNLTKSLSFSLYRVHYLPLNRVTEQQASSTLSNDYNNYINQTYSSEQLEVLLNKVCHAIGGNVLNVASQNYSPQGASVTLMISEEAKPESLIAHLDKSHLCIHTYPEETTQQNIAIFRADIELSTCGIISPLSVLDYVIDAFSADVVDIDYRVRGMTRDKQGKKHFSDHDIANISEYLNANTHASYQIKDSVMACHNLYHCKLSRKNIDLNHHIFSEQNLLFSTTEKKQISTKIMTELAELSAGK